MIFKTLHDKIRIAVDFLQHFVHRIWYPPLIGFLAALDNLIVVVPTDGILVSSSMLTPKRWVVLAFSIALGSTVGAIVLAGIVEFYGLQMIIDYYPHVMDTRTWALTEQFFDQYGLILVFGIAMTPLMQQPSIILAGLAGTSLLQLAVVVFVGRFLKFLLIAYLGSHAPKFLKRVWGMKGEMQDAGVKLS